MTGLVRHTLGSERYLEFHYRVVRIWQRPVEAMLSAGVGALPLAPLADVNLADLPGVIGAMHTRLKSEVTLSEAAQLWTATYVLMGLRYDQALVTKLLQGVRAMEESVTYQAIISKGRTEGEAKGKAEGMALGEAEGAAGEARRILLLLGTDAFGKPDAAAQAAIGRLHDCEKLEALIKRVRKVKGWQELLATPRLPQRNGGKRRA